MAQHGKDDIHAEYNRFPIDLQSPMFAAVRKGEKMPCCFILRPLGTALYMTSGHAFLNWPLPAFFDGNYTAYGIVQMLLALAVMVINKKFFVNGFKSTLNGAPNMDALVALGSGASFVWSTVVLLAITRAQADGRLDLVKQYAGDFYFESAAMILALITVGKPIRFDEEAFFHKLDALIKASFENGNHIKEMIEDVCGTYRITDN